MASMLPYIAYMDPMGYILCIRIIYILYIMGKFHPAEACSKPVLWVKIW